MKIALISDLHIGVKKGNEIFLNSQMLFFKNQMIPYLKTNNIDYLFILGDLFDNRSAINTRINNEVFKLFRDDLAFLKHIYILVGNHDTYFNTSIEVNSLKFLSKFDNVSLIEELTVVDIYDKQILLVPWIVDGDLFLPEFKKKQFDVCFGHFDIMGFNFNKSKVSDHGIPVNVFFDTGKKFFSGHFHIRSSQSSNGSEIVYIGSPYQITRNDIDEDRGFCVLDTDSLEYEYVNNTCSLKYIKLNFPEEFTQLDISGNIIDVYVTFDDTYDEKLVEQYIKKIDSYTPIDKPNIFVVNSSTINGELNIDDYNVKSLADLIRDYIDISDILNKDDIYKILIELYEEAKGDL